MQLPSALRSLDNRILSSRSRRRRAPDGVRYSETSEAGAGDARDERDGATRSPGAPRRRRLGGDGLSAVLAVVWRVSRLVLVALGLLLLLAIAFLILPTNDSNVVVRTVQSWATSVAGPLKDVFVVADKDRQRIYNYALAAVIYFVLAAVVGKLPTGRRSRS